jgi:large subunit ribosomal protein L22
VATAGAQREVRAVAKWVRMSPRKARIVADHIRGRSVPEARTVLAFTQRAAARELEKVLRSAVANAEANHGLIGDELVVSAAYVDEGPVMKRWRARARGRVARIKKPTCHITVKLAAADGAVLPTARPAPTPPPAPEPGAEPASEQPDEQPKPTPRAVDPEGPDTGGDPNATTQKTKRTRTRKEAPKKSQASSDES